jgi:hypothetical protein
LPPLIRGTAERSEHIFHGEINKIGKVVGFHHRVSIGHQGHARIVGITRAPNAQGVYEATNIGRQLNFGLRLQVSRYRGGIQL